VQRPPGAARYLKVSHTPSRRRKDRLDALRSSEAQYRRLFETAQDGILILDALTGFITDVNPFLIRLLDYTREDFIGKTLWDLVAFKQIQESKAAFRELQDKRYIRYEDLPLETRSGGRVNVEFVSNVYDVDGKSVIQCNIRDITARRQNDEALQQTRQRLSGIVTSAMDAIITVDEQQRIVLFNAAAETIFLCPQAEAMGQSIERFIPQRFHAAHSVHIRKFDESGISNRAKGTLETLWAVRANGEEFQMEASLSKVEVAGKKLFTVIIRDVSARKRSEEALREYQRVVEGLEEMIVVVDRDYRYVIANRAFLTFRELSAEQVIGHKVEDVVGQDVFTTHVKGKMDECFRGKVVQYEMVYDFENPGKRDLFVAYYPIESAHGVDRIAGIMQDITDRKRSEQALYKSEERFSKAFRSNPLALTISTEVEGRYLDVNNAFLDLLGYRRQDVIGRTSADLRYWAEPLDRMEMLRQLKQNERLAKHPVRFKTAKGKIREAEVWLEKIELDGQRCLLGITRDVTEVQQLEAQFRQAQKMDAVGRLAGGIAHDFNNILGIVIGYGDLSLGLIPADNLANRYVSESKKAAQRAALLTRQLLAFSRKQVAFPRILDLNDVVHNATSMFLRLVGEDIEIEFRPSRPLGSIKVDPGQIEQVLMNLVVNARDAMPSGGKIIIETADAELDDEYVSRHPGSRAGRHVVLVVSDTGCGMDESIKSQLFEPFFTTKAPGHGTGLGLSTVYGIVKQSDGYIVVYSETGKGTTFKIYFPRVGGKAEELVLFRVEGEPARGSGTVLVVEDDKSMREITVKLLQDGGYRVVDAKDAEEALKILQAHSPEIDLLLTDVIMTGMSGAELVEQAKKGDRKLRVLFMSGYASDLVERQGVVMREASFLEKPFTRQSLLAKVYAALESNTNVK
jgi:two-component system cell cycle sensor histidine kinase/response regulator CckA